MAQVFIISVDTFIEELSNMHQPDQSDLSQGHSNNRHFSGNQRDSPKKAYSFGAVAITITKLDLRIPTVMVYFLSKN